MALSIKLQMKIAAMMADEGLSYWFKECLAGALRRDCLDAARDARLLADLLAERLVEIETGEIAALTLENECDNAC